MASPKNNKPINGYRAKQTLDRLAQEYSQRTRQEWRNYFTLQNALRKNPVLIAAFYQTANGDFAKIHGLFHNAHRYVLNQVAEYQRNGISQDPTHPAVTNNPNHPLNPANANALRRNLMINPALNPLFLFDLNNQASVDLEENNLQNILNESLQTTLNSALVLTAAAAALTRDPELDPHKVLNLQPNASKEEIQTASLRALSEEAPDPLYDQTTCSHRFEAAAAAAVMLNSSLVVSSHKELLESFNKHLHLGNNHPSPTLVAG